MGFKDLNLFNHALLAKQVWRLIQNLNALWVQIVKRIHFPFRDIMDAKLGLNPSWGWSCLLQGRDALSLGLRWHVTSPSYIKCVV